MRNFNDWLSTMRDSISTWKYYTDFEKVYRNVDAIKIELNILNSLIGSKNIETDFKNILTDYPKTLKVIPILLAKREMEIKIKDAEKEYLFNFKKMNYTIDEYSKFMRNTGLFDLLENHIINNLVDYIMGVEVGMDTNGRKNRTGEAMEDLVESYLIKYGLVKNKTYFKEMTKTEIEKKFNYDLSKISNNGKTEKRFDFVVKIDNRIYAIECNFYGSSGSKLNETARSYKNLALESKQIDEFIFVWITDGIGWNTAKHNLEETFDVLDTLYNLKDLDEGVLSSLFK
ncbi:MAG: type II restriction endonuclease [Acholeplasmatales bacterium]|nr:type II restriction endonuclease [Acholeplasmatales bacterium]MDD7395542.1 type II restriction endonuclease [Acholeplasmatales bacterium]MDY4016285.1 type II restriction endonuclease [Bacilli bacterium]